MTYEEAIKWLNIEIEIWEAECKSLHPTKDALKVAIKSLEKQIPQKPYKVGIRDYECPKCHKVLHVVGYPCRCGQAISWEGEE